MKTLRSIIYLIIMVVIGIAGYNYFVGGKGLSLQLPTGREKGYGADELSTLRSAFGKAQKQYNQAHRSAAMGGVNSSSDDEDVARQVADIKNKLDRLEPSLTSESDKKKAADLRWSIEALKSAMSR